MSEEKLTIDGFGDVEMDAIGEIMNITMGSAATAVSNMLSAKVWITTPQVKVIRSEDLSFPELEPSIMVKIKYTQGVSGENVLVLKQNDVQLILNQLMGLPLEVSDDFQFDEMNISAVCEVMNQMMGASATALSEIIETTVDISTPEAVVQEGGADAVRQEIYDLTGQDFVCTVKFDLTIDGVIKSEFISVLTISLAKEMADKMMTGYNNIMDSIEEAEPAPAPAPAASSAPAGGGASMSQEQIEAMMGGGTAPQPAAPQMPQQPVGAVPMPGAPAGAMPQMPYGQPMDPNMAAMYGGYPPQGMYPQMPMQPAMPPMNVQPVQLQNFAAYQNANLNQDQNDNLKLLMNVPLNVTVEIGSAVKKVKEILDFSQGTIIELERQAGAPVDIIVNGNLIAKGDVVVIDDNFAVRITEIIKSKFLESLGGKE
ncbi:MAG: flagellar motor switch phosphatase FliY [Oscillospiraceae bacterium]|nr:flagellar motor switch phosphatase FliY [Oscillospiraceae bacterium]